MANDREIDLIIRAKNMSAETFEKVKAAIRSIESEAEKATKTSSGHWGKMFATISGGVAVGNLVSAAFQRVGATLATLPGQFLALGQRGADVADVAGAFDRLTGSIGQSAAVVKQELREAFGGTVTDFDLMKSANEALSRGVVLTADQFGTLARGARVVADAVGGDAKEKFDLFMKAMATGNDKTLKEAGVNLAEVSKATSAYARQLGVEESSLTLVQKQQAIRNALIIEANRLVKEAGGVENDFSDNLQRAGVMWTNVTDRVAVAIAQSPAVNAAMEHIGTALEAAFGKDRDEQVQTLQKGIGVMAVAAVRGASFIVGAAGQIASAYYAARDAVDSVVKSFSDAQVRDAQRAIDKLKQLYGEDLPNHAKTRIADLQAKLDYWSGFSKGLMDDAEQSAKASGRVADLAQKAQTWLGEMATAMEKAEGQAKAAAVGNDALRKSLQATEVDSEAAADANMHLSQVLRGLTDAQKISTVALDNAGLATKDIAAKLGVAEIAVKNYLEGVKRAYDAEKAWLDLRRDMAKQAHELQAKVIADMQAGWLAEAEGRAQSVVAQLNALKEFENKNAEIGRSGSDLRLHQIDVEYREAVAKLAARFGQEGELYRRAKAEIDAYYQHLRDLAAGTASTLTERMRAVGVYTRAELRQMAEAAQRDYDQMKASGEYSAAALAAAAERARLAWENAGLGVQGLRKAIESVGDIAARIGDSLASIFGGKFADAINHVTDAWRRAGQAADAYAKAAASGDRLGQAAAIAEGAAAVWEAAGAKNRWSAVGGGAAAGAKVGTAILPGWGTAIGAAAGAIAGLIRSAGQGREAIEAFVKGTVGSFDAMHARLSTLGPEGERLWVQFSQGVGKNNVRQAQAAIDAVTKAFAKQEDQIRKTGQTAIDAAKDEVTAQQKVIDEIANRREESARKIADLTKRIDAEAWEKEIGIEETRDREERDREIEKLKAIEAEQKKAEERQAELMERQAKAVQDLADALKKLTERTWTIPVRLSVDDSGLPSGESDDSGASHAAGAYIRQDHVARVHAGEIVGPMDFMTRALAGALGTAGMRPIVINAPLMIGGEVVGWIDQRIDARGARNMQTGRWRPRVAAGRGY